MVHELAFRIEIIYIYKTNMIKSWLTFVIFFIPNRKYRFYFESKV